MKNEKCKMKNGGRARPRGELPHIPASNTRGLRPAVEAGRVILARGLIRDRLKAGLTQRELARLAGVRPETLSRLETGRHIPTEETLQRIDQALRRTRKKPPRTKTG